MSQPVDAENRPIKRGDQFYHDKWLDPKTNQPLRIVITKTGGSDGRIYWKGIGDKKAMFYTMPDRTKGWKRITEDVNVPVKKGDTILVGKWKNKPIKVTSQGEDDHGMPTINGRKAVTFRKPQAEGRHPMKISRTTLQALVEAELAEMGDKMTRLGGRYGGEPDIAIADPGNKDVPNPVVQTSKNGGSNKSIRRPIKEVTDLIWRVSSTGQDKEAAIRDAEKLKKAGVEAAARHWLSSGGWGAFVNPLQMKKAMKILGNP